MSTASRRDVSDGRPQGVPLLELDSITKRYGELLANDRISLSIAPGEVVAMLGENGAGKSTLMKVVYGLVRPDAGTVAMDGRRLTISSPRDAMAAGIGMVTQEFSLVETMTVAENVALSGIGLGRLDHGAVRRGVVKAMERIGVSLDPDQLVSTLSIGERQRVEIVKALVHDCRVVILDEPTAVLTPQDVRALFETIRRLRDANLGVLLVSHKLREVAEISDRVVVLRRGRLVGTRITGQVDDVELAALMMGSTEIPTSVDDPDLSAELGMANRSDETADPPQRRPVASGDAVLETQGLTLNRGGRDRLRDVSIRVAAGEIVGVAGVSGNGQTELVSVLSGIEQPTAGSIRVEGNDVTRSDVSQRLRAGLGRLTEDRRGSIVPQLSVEQNLAIEDLPAFSRRGLLDHRAIRRHAEQMIERFDIRARPGDPIGTLSGGNMQKVLLARALSREPRVLVVSQPTRGLDIGACGYVHEQLRALRDGGGGVLLISEDLDELRSLSDRIVVLFGGEIVGDVAVADASAKQLGVLMAGGVAA